MIKHILGINSHILEKLLSVHIQEYKHFKNIEIQAKHVMKIFKWKKNIIQSSFLKISSLCVLVLVKIYRT